MKKPMCEVCGKQPAVSFSWFPEGLRQMGPHGAWKLTCYCTSGREHYYVLFDRFLEKPASPAEWVRHLQGKIWFDASDFFEAVGRFETHQETEF